MSGRGRKRDRVGKGEGKRGVEKGEGKEKERGVGERVEEGETVRS